MNESQMRKLQEDNDMAFFRADMCLESPGSFTVEETARICDEMISTNKAIEDAMRDDFESLAPELRAALLDLLCDSGEMTSEWWCELLLGKMPDSPDDIFEY